LGVRSSSGQINLCDRPAPACTTPFCGSTSGPSSPANVDIASCTGYCSLAAFVAPYMEVTPLAEARPLSAAPAASADVFGADFDLPSWMEQHEDDRRPMSTSSGNDSVFEPAPVSAASYSAPLVAARPTLQARDMVIATRSAFGPAQAQLLVPTILRCFATQLIA